MDPSSDHHGVADKPPLLAGAAPPGSASVTSSSAPAPPMPSLASELAVPVGDAKAALGKPRGKRTTLSLHEKFIVKTFCDQQVSESKARADFVPSHDALRQEIANKFGWEVGRSTLSKIMCMDWQQLQVQAHPNPNMKRKRKPLFPAFEEDLVKAMRAHLARHDGIGAQLLPDDTLPGGGSGSRSAPVLTEAFIMEEAQRLKQQHGIKDEELVLSVGWLARFKHRNGIRLRKGTITTMESGDAAMAPSSSSLPMALHFGDLASKRLKKNALGAPGRWPMNFQLPSPYTGSGIDQPAAALASVSDLRTTCVYHATASGDPSDPVEVVPSSLLHGIPAAVQPFCCPHCPVSLSTGIEGLHVAVIGFNCTRDAFLAAALVGEHGSVTCFEANPVASATAEEYTDAYAVKTLGYATSNLRMLNVVALDHSSNSALVARHDLAFFNCSFQGAAHKALLLEVAFNLLLEGGECRLSYVSSTRRLQSLPSLQQASTSLAIDDLVSASVYVEDFRRMCQHVGFLDPRCLRVHKFQDQQGVDVHHQHHHQDISVTTARLFKLGLVEDRPEDYGERATYTGGAVSTDTPAALVYRLDAQFTFMRDVSMAVDGNTSQILRLSWLKRFFNVEGDRMTHRGRFTYTL